jgi:hypothetical protein
LSPSGPWLRLLTSFLTAVACVAKNFSSFHCFSLGYCPMHTYLFNLSYKPLTHFIFPPKSNNEFTCNFRLNFFPIYILFAFVSYRRVPLVVFQSPRFLGHPRFGMHSSSCFPVPWDDVLMPDTYYPPSEPCLGGQY